MAFDAASAIVERAFTLNGIGSYLIQAALSKDVAVVQGISLVIVAVEGRRLLVEILNRSLGINESDLTSGHSRAEGSFCSSIRPMLRARSPDGVPKRGRKPGSLPLPAPGTMARSSVRPCPCRPAA